MKRELLSAAFLLGLSGIAVAEVSQSHRCERGGIERTVQLTSDNDSGVPCAVVYEKPMEDQSITRLWTAQNDAEFCKEKYDSFIVKLESKLNWACAASDTSASVVSQRPTPDTSASNSTPAATATTEITQAEVTTVEKAAPVPTTPATTTTQTIERPLIVRERIREAPLTPSTEEPVPTTPTPAAALPAVTARDPQRYGFGLNFIRTVFPTAYYRQAPDNPHTGDTALCPADGFYIWNTQLPGKPTFEMGGQTAFIFNLNPLVEEPRAVDTGNIGTEQCNYTVQSSYCLNNVQKEGSLISSTSASSVSCGLENSGDAPVRTLALISNSLSYTVPVACQANAPAASMALATLPAKADSAQPGFELAIEVNAGASVRIANCRYFKGR